MLVRKTHQLDETLTKLVKFATGLHQAFGHSDIAVGRGSNCKRILRIHAIAVGQVLSHHRG